MTYILAQGFGFLATLCCLVCFQLKKKWQMLILLAVANGANAMNFLLLGQGSGSIICFVGIAQILADMFYNGKHQYTPPFVQGVFTVLYLGCGLMQFRGWHDIFPLVGSMLFMCSVFQKTEQRMRWFSIAQSCAWMTYGILVRSSSVFAQLVSLISTIVALYRFRSRKKKDVASNM